MRLQVRETVCFLNTSGDLWGLEVRATSLSSLSPISWSPGSFPVDQTVKNPPAMWETWVQSLGWEDSPGIFLEWQPTPIFLPGESPWTEEPGRLQSMGLQRVRHHWAIKHSTWSPGWVFPWSSSRGASSLLPLWFLPAHPEGPQRVARVLDLESTMRFEICQVSGS